MQNCRQTSSIVGCRDLNEMTRITTRRNVDENAEMMCGVTRSYKIRNEHITVIARVAHEFTKITENDSSGRA